MTDNHLTMSGSRMLAVTLILTIVSFGLVGLGVTSIVMLTKSGAFDQKDKASPTASVAMATACVAVALGVVVGSISGIMYAMELKEYRGAGRAAYSALEGGGEL